MDIFFRNVFITIWKRRKVIRPEVSKVNRRTAKKSSQLTLYNSINHRWNRKFNFVVVALAVVRYCWMLLIMMANVSHEIRVCFFFAISIFRAKFSFFVCGICYRLFYLLVFDMQSTQLSNINNQLFAGDFEMNFQKKIVCLFSLWMIKHIIH